MDPGEEKGANHAAFSPRQPFPNPTRVIPQVKGLGFSHTPAPFREKQPHVQAQHHFRERGGGRAVEKGL